MKRVLIFGNSGSGKSTLAKKLSRLHGLSHLDLDTLAWQPVVPPERKPLDISKREIDQFLKGNSSWVIEGGYTDLLEMTLPLCEHMIFMNLTREECISNARSRPWEPHKYSSKDDQDKNLDMLIEWISQYDQRTDTFSEQSHQALYMTFDGKKMMYTSNH